MNSTQSTNTTSAKKMPNILYIMADQMAAPILPIYDKKSVVKMPHLSGLADKGVVFENAYTNSPLCAPSRFVMLAGQLPSKIGAYDNATQLASDTPTLAHHLRVLGYHTAISGKMHFVGPDQLHGYEQRLTSDIYPGDFGWSVNWDEAELRLDWYHNMSSVTDAGVCVRSNQIDYDEEVMYRAKNYLYNHVRRRKDQPFFLTVSMTHPHDPYTARQEFWDLYKDTEIPLPEYEPSYDELDPHSQRIQKVIDLYGKPMEDEQKKAARRAYFANCSYVDDNIGKLLKVLEECHLTEDTIIMFSGDHGDMLGERSLWYKMNFYEMSARIPLVIYHPQQFGSRRVKEVVSSMDYLPTLVDLATNGTGSAKVNEAGHIIDGASLYPLCEGKAGRDLVLGEYMGEGTVSPLFMIRTGKWKYITCSTDPPQLFNLEEDPQEKTNLAAKEEYAELVENFQRDINSRCDVRKIHDQVLQSQRTRRFCWKALTKGKRTHWDFQAFFDTRDEYVRNGESVLDDVEAIARYPRVVMSSPSSMPLNYEEDLKKQEIKN